jgi:hypothetical protein
MFLPKFQHFGVVLPTARPVTVASPPSFRQACMYFAGKVKNKRCTEKYTMWPSIIGVAEYFWVRLDFNPDFMHIL